MGSACRGARHERQIGGSTRILNHLRFRRIRIFPEKDGHGPTLRNT
ncbi:Excinuclease ABC subunit C [Altererythrobacter epoxidivorans]|uniref:Excinuclease ABC subunit C n=1 Tax=Altererythrobacter epoxidivorans TaxID=361183 RepID=A0A0M5KY64_9SPHN|nr:Excinuclease ABC subunit C [Altererythrobacter epoxidivorans]